MCERGGGEEEERRKRGEGEEEGVVGCMTQWCAACSMRVYIARDDLHELMKGDGAILIDAVEGGEDGIQLRVLGLEAVRSHHSLELEGAV